jgi:hypothetical protein
MAHGHERGKFLKRAGLVILMGACAMLLSASQAGAVIIDHFQSALSPDTHIGAVLSVNGANTLDCSTQTGLATVLGGSRKAILHYLSGTGTGSEASSEDITSPDHFLTYNNGSDDTSELTLIYNGTGSGLGDLTAGGATQIILNLFRADLNASVKITAVDSANNTASDTINVLTDITVPTPLVFPFSDFAGVNFSNIKSLTVLLTNVNNTVAVDYEIDAIETNTVPEPLTMLGMFLGLGGVGAYIRKRRMA